MYPCLIITFAFICTYFVTGGLLFVYDSMHQRCLDDYPYDLKQVVLLNFIVFFVLNVIGLQEVHISNENSNMITMVTQMAFFCISFEIFFYIHHRILHLRFFYFNIHSLHHTLRKPVALAAIYCHPLEFIFLNYIPAVSGILIYDVLRNKLGFEQKLSELHLSTINIWNIIVCTGALYSHSGYVKNSWDQGKHLLHHQHQNVNFGVFGVMDSIFQTARHF